MVAALAVGDEPGVKLMTYDEMEAVSDKVGGRVGGLVFCMLLGGAPPACLCLQLLHCYIATWHHSRTDGRLNIAAPHTNGELPVQCQLRAGANSCLCLRVARYLWGTKS